MNRTGKGRPPPRAEGIRRKTLGRIEPRGDGSRARIHFSLSCPTGPIRTNPACRARQSSRGFSGIRMSFPLFVRWLLWPFSFLFGVFVRMRAWCYRVGILAAKSLRQPVISIGNLTIGGTGKTPLVLWLAQRLQAQGKRVGILRSEEHTSELQSPCNLVCRLLLEKKKTRRSISPSPL